MSGIGGHNSSAEQTHTTRLFAGIETFRDLRERVATFLTLDHASVGGGVGEDNKSRTEAVELLGQLLLTSDQVR